jgi:ribonuclease R
MKDFYHFDEEHLTLTGEKTNMKYSIGDRVVVKVVRASKEDQTIDFEIVRKVK